MQQRLACIAVVMAQFRSRSAKASVVRRQVRGAEGPSDAEGGGGAGVSGEPFDEDEDRRREEEEAEMPVLADELER